jgi:hypothetical protein
VLRFQPRCVLGVDRSGSVRIPAEIESWVCELRRLGVDRQRTSSVRLPVVVLGLRRWLGGRGSAEAGDQIGRVGHVRIGLGAALGRIGFWHSDEVVGVGVGVVGHWMFLSRPLEVPGNGPRQTFRRGSLCCPAVWDLPQNSLGTFPPDLATSLNNLSVQQSETGGRRGTGVDHRSRPDPPTAGAHPGPSRTARHNRRKAGLGGDRRRRSTGERAERATGMEPAWPGWEDGHAADM